MPIAFLTALIPNSQEVTAADARPSNVSQVCYVGATQYRVTLAQLAPGVGELNVYKFTGGVWSLVVSDNTRKPVSVSTVVVGSIIYIVGTDDFIHMKMFRFDTVAGAFIGTVVGPAWSNLNSYQTLTLLADGTTLLMVSNDNTGDDLAAALFDTVTNLWGINAVIFTPAIGAVFPYGAVLDPITGNVFVTIGLINDETVDCISIAPALTHGAPQVVFTPTLNGQVFQSAMRVAVGTPTISGGQIVVPFLDQFSALTGDATTVNVARATPALNPIFGVPELVETVSNINPLYIPTTYTGGGLFYRDLVAVDQAGTLYVFYGVDNGDLESPASLSFLYYQSSTVANVWTAPTLAIAGPAPSEILSPFVNLDNNGLIALSVSFLDPTIGLDVTGLTTQYLYQAAPAPTNPPSTLYVNMNSAPVIALPNPATVCGHGRRRAPEFQKQAERPKKC